MSEIFFSLLRYGVAAGIGAVLGALFARRGKIKLLGREVAVPYIERTNKHFTLVVVVLMTLSIVAVINTSLSNARQADCNAEFRRVIKERSEITTQDNELRSRLDMLNTADNEALRGLVREILVTPPPSAEQVRTSITTFQSRIQADASNRDGIQEKQAQLAAERKANAYPEPKCNA